MAFLPFSFIPKRTFIRGQGGDAISETSHLETEPPSKHDVIGREGFLYLHKSDPTSFRGRVSAHQMTQYCFVHSMSWAGGEESLNAIKFCFKFFPSYSQCPEAPYDLYIP